MEAILGAVSNIFGGIAGIVTADKQLKAARYAKLPPWLSARDFYEKDYTLTIIVGGMVAIAIVLVIALAKK